MVKNTGETLRSSASYKSLNTPDRLQVDEDAKGRPSVIKEKRRLRIQTIDDYWRVDDEWWRLEPVSRLYYLIYLTTGRSMVIYKDLIHGNWYRQSY